MSRPDVFCGLLSLLAGLWVGTWSSAQPGLPVSRSAGSIAPRRSASVDCDCDERVQQATARAERLCQERIERLGGVEPPPFPEDLDPRYRPEGVEVLAEVLRECEGLAEQVLVECDEYPCILMLTGSGTHQVRDCGLDLDGVFSRVGLEPGTMAPIMTVLGLAPRDRVSEQEKRQLQTRFEARQVWLYEQRQSDTGNP
jgi:hypothetical protein